MVFTGQNGRQIALHISRERWQLELSKLYRGLELASNFSTLSLADEAGGHKSDRADQQDIQFVLYLHSVNVLINKLPNRPK